MKKFFASLTNDFIDYLVKRIEEHLEEQISHYGLSTEYVGGYRAAISCLKNLKEREV